MTLDAAISARSSLLSLPNEVLHHISEYIVSGSQLPAKTRRHKPLTFEQLWSDRQAHKSSAYSVRLVCRLLDGAAVKPLFREVRIRLGWNFLFINPPLRELAEGAMGLVFRENARVLNLDHILLPDDIKFVDDTPRDHHHNSTLPEEVLHHYPEPMTQEEKVKKYEELMEEVRQTLPAAMASMPKLVEIRYKMDMRPIFQWIGSAFSEGLSALSNVRIVKIHAQKQSTGEDSRIGKHLQAIGSMKSLHTFEFSSIYTCNLSSGLDGLWRTMQASGVRLRSISVCDASMMLLEYLASFSGLEYLALSWSGANDRDNPNQEALAFFLFKTVLAKHRRTLSHLTLPTQGSCWSVGNHNITELAGCLSLASLTIPLFVSGEIYTDNIRESLTLLFEHIQILPSLHQITLKMTMIGRRLRGGIAKPSIFLHDTVTRMDHSDTSLAPKVLTIMYSSDSRIVDYRLIQQESRSGAKTWRYHADRPEWLGVTYTVTLAIFDGSVDWHVTRW